MGPQGPATARTLSPRLLDCAQRQQEQGSSERGRKVLRPTVRTSRWEQPILTAPYRVTAETGGKTKTA